MITCLLRQYIREIEIFHVLLPAAYRVAFFTVRICFQRSSSVPDCLFTGFIQHKPHTDPRKTLRKLHTGWHSVITHGYKTICLNVIFSLHNDFPVNRYRCINLWNGDNHFLFLLLYRHLFNKVCHGFQHRFFPDFSHILVIVNRCSPEVQPQSFAD